MDFETLLRKRNQQGEHLIGLCCLANYIEHL